MSGTCSAHKHYERDCPRCQTEKPEWVLALEAEVVALKAALDEIAGLYFDGVSTQLPSELRQRIDALTKEETP